MRLPYPWKALMRRLSDRNPAKYNRPYGKSRFQPNSGRRIQRSIRIHAVEFGAGGIRPNESGIGPGALDPMFDVLAATLCVYSPKGACHPGGAGPDTGILLPPAGKELSAGCPEGTR